eukprot:4172869-Pleurochrysis_carterae.AAC.1
MDERVVGVHDERVFHAEGLQEARVRRRPVHVEEHLFGASVSSIPFVTVREALLHSCTVEHQVLVLPAFTQRRPRPVQVVELVLVLGFQTQRQLALEAEQIRVSCGRHNCHVHAWCLVRK